MDDPGAVEIAIWFHDAIYEPGAKDNEQRSAELFQKYAQASGCSDVAFQRRIHDLIMITTHHEQPGWKDEQFIVDIDLSSFGLPWDEFEQDGRRIRAECAEMSDDAYYPGHVKFLQMLQERPTFFFTDFFQKRYEQTARENIERLITSLRKRGYD
jgi:predicted metal-dependent HD superfamily phosphohydrolase